MIRPIRVRRITVACALIIGVVSNLGVASAVEKKKKKAKPKPKAVASKPVATKVPTKPVAAPVPVPAKTTDVLGRSYCGEAGVQLRVPVTTIPCQTPLPAEQLATKEALLAAYERYWITYVAVERELRVARSQYRKILIAEAFNEKVSDAEKRSKTNEYWDGSRADIQLLNPRIRTISKIDAVLEDCVTIGGVVRVHGTGAVVPGTDQVDRLAYQFTASNFDGVWLFTRVGVTDDASLERTSTCTASDA
jgi:hypothetical protein